MCKFCNVTPKYINIKISGKNKQSQNTLQAAITYRITQELKLLFTKKQQLNEQLYHLHLTCAAEWQEFWPLRQDNIDNKLQNQTQQKYDRLNKKLDSLKKGETIAPKHREET
jgi:hypothetical protein